MSSGLDLNCDSVAALESVDASNQAVEPSIRTVEFDDGPGGDQKRRADLEAELDFGDKGRAELVAVAVSNVGFEAVEDERLEVSANLREEQVGVDLADEGVQEVVDDQLGSNEREVEGESLRIQPPEVDTGGQESADLIAVAAEEFEAVEASDQAVNLGDGSGGDQKQGIGFHDEGMVNEDSVTTEVFEPVKASDQAISLVHRSGDDQRLLNDVDAEGLFGISEDSSASSVGSGAPEDEISEVSLVFSNKQAVDDELDTRKKEAEFNPFSNRCMEVDMGEKGSALVGASADLSEAVEASSEVMNMGDGSGGDQKPGVDVGTEGLMGTDEVSHTVLISVGDDNEKMEGSSILRREQQLEIQVDIVDESDHALGAQLGCVESKGEVDSHEQMLLELRTEKKDSVDMVAASAEEFDATEASNRAMNSGDGSSCGDQMQGIDSVAKEMDLDVQFGTGERNAEVKYHSVKLLEVDERENESAEPVAVLTEIFEPVAISSCQVNDFGDESDGDPKQGTDVNVEGMTIDTELSPGKSVAEVESHGEKLLDVDKDDEGNTELPAISTEGVFLPCEANSELMNFVNECGDDQRLETEVDAESMVRTDKDSVAISIVSEEPEDARLEGSSISLEEHVEVQDNFVNRINDVVEGEMGTTTSVAEVSFYGEGYMEVDIGEKGSTKLVASSIECSEAVEASNQVNELGDGSGSDQIQGVDADAEGMVRNEDSVTVLIVGGALGNESLEGPLTSGTEQVEVMVHLVDGCGLVENEHESHGQKLLEVELVERRKELFAVSAERFEAVEVSCQAMDLGDRSSGDQTQGIDVHTEDMVDVSDDSAAILAGGGDPEDDMLKEESPVLGIGHVEALEKTVDGYGKVVDGKLIHVEKTPIVYSHRGKSLKVKTEAKGGIEPFVISSKRFDAVETCSLAMDLENGSSGNQKQETDVAVECVVGTSGDFVNVSGADGEPEDVSLGKSLLSGKEYNEVLQDLVDGHNQVLDDEFGPVKRDAEVEPHSEKLLELDVKEKGSAELASFPVVDSGAVEASSQDVELEDGYSSEQKQESNVGVACMVKTDEDFVVVSVDGGGLENEMPNRSSNLVKEVAVGEETPASGSTVKILHESTKNESAGYDGTMIHAVQVQTEFDGGQSQDTGVGAETMLGGTEQAPLAVSNDFAEKQVRVGEDNIGPGTPEKKLVNPEKIGGCEVYAMRNNWHVKDPVHSKHVEDLESRDGFCDDHTTESCMETVAEPLVIAVASQGLEAQRLEVAPRSDGEQASDKCGSDESQMVETGAKPLVIAVASQGVEAQRLEVAPRSDGEQANDKSGSDESQMVEEVALFQRSGDSENVDVHCDSVEGHPQEREGEIIGDSGHNLSEVNCKISAGEEDMVEKGLPCLPESVEQDISLECFQVSELELMEVETGIVDHSTVSSERVEVLTQASSAENDPTIYDENNTLAGETVQKLDSIPIIEEEDTDLQEEDGDIKTIVVCGSTVGIDVAKTAMTLDAAANVEAWSSDEHKTVDNMVEKRNFLLEDKGSVMIVTAELQNGDAQVNFDYQNKKIDSSSLSCRGEEVDGEGPHLPGNFFMKNGYSSMEDSNSLLGISIPESSPELVNLTIPSQWNEPSVGCQDVPPPNIPSREQEELDPEQGTPALESTFHAVDETIDCSQKLQDGTQENLRESKNQSEGCDDTETESASTSERATYYLSFPEKEGFSTSDLVWGKVKSHPWWPGQIFDISGASKLAMKYQKKDHFLVAYFGDKTFAWCEESRLNPFQSCFSQMEKQTSSDSFLCALRDILVEISRRVELSMTCLCLPEETYADIKYQKVDNAGLRGKIVHSVFDRSEIVNYFHPDQLLEYVKSLALLPTGGADRLELTVAQAQLKAFYLSKGYTELPAFTNGSGLVEHDFEIPSSISKKLHEDDLEHSATLSDLFSTKGKLRSRDGSLGKQKQIVEDGRKQKSLSELMEEETTFLLVDKHENPSEVQDDENCYSSGNKRKALDYVSTDIGRSKTKKIDTQDDEETKLSSPTSNISFKVGAFISRAASKLTSGQPIRKCIGETSERGLSKIDDWSVDYMDIDDFLNVNFDYSKLQMDILEDYPPTNEMLSKLCLAARNPLRGYNFSSIVINFFCTFRNVQVSNISIEKNKAEKPRAKRGRKKKIILDLQSPDMSTPDHMKDSYWSDMVIPEKDAPLNPPKRRGRKKTKFIDESPSSVMSNSPPDCEPKLHTGTMCPHVKHILTPERPIISVEEKIVDERTPTAVILYFNSSNSLPSDTDLIRIFSRYGPLKEEETFIEKKNNSAMVVFKKRTDAEMAFSSAGKFSTFGPALLSYRLRHFPFKSSPVNTLIGEDDAMPSKDGHLGILAEPEVNAALDGKLCEDVDKESSIFVQSHGHFRSALDSPQGAGEFSELAQYQVRDVVVSDSATANTGEKEPLQNVPTQMETGAGSDHLLLESLDPEFSYFDLDRAVAGDISGTEVGGENSSSLLLETLEVSHAANDRSVGDESCDPVIAAENPKHVAIVTSDSLAEQLENGMVLETSTQQEAIDQEFSGSVPPAEAKDIPEEFNIAPDQPGEQECSYSPPAQAGAGTSDQSSVTIDAQLMEADSCAMEVPTLSSSFTHQC